MLGFIVIALIVRLTQSRTQPTEGPPTSNPSTTASTIQKSATTPQTTNTFPADASTDKSKTLGPASATSTAAGEAALQKIQASATAIRRLYDQTHLRPAAEREQLQESIHTQCEALKRLLLEMPDDVATDGMLRYLQTNEDTPTSLPFDVGEDGPLNQAPSLRTLLLDLLGQTGPEESVAFANQIFEKSDSPDEWALALRNLGWHDLDGENRATMLTRFQEMITRTDWTQSPTDGFLESLDISVHLGFESTADLVAALVEPRPQPPASDTPAETDLPPPQPPPVTHAATLALHRMAIGDPAPVVERLGTDPTYLQQAPSYRASLLARADVRDPQQAAALATYLTQTNVLPQEHLAFLSEFPNRNGILTNALVSTLPPHLEFDQNAAIDRAALVLVEQWIQNGLNPTLNDALIQTRDRLNEHVNAAALAIPTALPPLDKPKVPERDPDSN